MNPIDYIYRFDPKNPRIKPPPPDAEAAKRTLEDGNRMFANWMESCRTHDVSKGESRYVVQCNGLEVGMNLSQGNVPKQAPFAVVVGCSDARVPTEMLFGQGFNDLFVIRVAGNVLGDVCMGSIDFALNALSESVKVVVMLGHSRCGAVTGAVDAYLQPVKFWSRSMSPTLRSIIQRIFVAVRESANGLREVWGPDARSVPGYREVLIETAVCVNAAHAAFDLRQEVERAGKWEIEVLYGVFNLHNHQVSMPSNPRAFHSPEGVRLAYAPTNPKDFLNLAIQMAETLKPEGAAVPRAGEREDGDARTLADPNREAKPAHSGTRKAR
jgi:carbonic anhydrase